MPVLLNAVEVIGPGAGSKAVINLSARPSAEIASEVYISVEYARLCPRS